jgi:hypothetical protein
VAGFVLHEDDGSIDTMAFEHRAGRIVAIYVVCGTQRSSSM